MRRSVARFVLIGSLWPWCALAETPLERAVTLAREKRFSESREILKGVQEPSETKQRIAFHRLKAANAAGLGDRAAAVEEMTLALALAPLDVTLLVGTAMVEFQAGMLAGALQHAESAGENATAKAVIGDIRERQGHVAEAARAYRAAVSLAPGQEEYRVSLAYYLIQHQNFREAGEFLEQSAPLFRQSARLRTLLGIALYSDGEAVKATASLVDAINADPQMDSAYRCLARIVLQSSSAQPPAVVDRLCRWNQTVCSALKLRSARQNGDGPAMTGAIAALRQASHDDPIARCELARAWAWTNRFREARTEMEACLKFDPSPQNHYRLGLIYKRLGLEGLSREQMDLRQRILDRMSEETAAGMSALEAFR